MTSVGTNTPAPPRQYSIGAVIGAGLAGVALGAAAAFAVTGLVFTVRVELPPPPYPQFSSTPPAPSTVAPPSAPSAVPVPQPLPLPPGPP